MESFDNNTQEHFSLDKTLANQQVYISQVYGWMSIALLITGAVAYLTANNPMLLQFIFTSSIIFYGIIIAELLLVVSIGAFVNKISAFTATVLFVLYAILNGLTLSLIFMVYTHGSIASTFFITAGTFGAMSIYGYTTKKDLTSMGNLFTMALFGLIIATIVNIFMKSEILYWITTYAGILIFVGLTAYDTQKIKNINIAAMQSDEAVKKGAILGALTLYLDFINLFLMLLRLFGKRK